MGVSLVYNHVARVGEAMVVPPKTKSRSLSPSISAMAWLEKYPPIRESETTKLLFPKFSYTFPTIALFANPPSLYINDGTGNFTLLLNNEFSDVSLGEVSLRDLDNDGDLDAFLIGTGEGGLANNAIVGNVYENLGNNNFVVSDSLIGGYFSSHAIADIDGDKDLDLVLGGTTLGTPTRATWLYTNETPITASTLEFSIANSSDIKIYPNPTTGTFTILLSTPSFDDNDRLDLYSITGKLLYSENLINTKTSVDLTSYPTGIYFIRTTIAGYSLTSRVVKN